MRLAHVVVALASGGCGLFPDVGGLGGGDAAIDVGAPDVVAGDAASDASADAADASDASAASDADSGPGGIRVVNVWNNIDDSTTLGPTIAVPVTNAAANALLACVREGSNNTDQFTVTDDHNQSWVKTTSGYDAVNVSSEMACFWVASSAALNTVTAMFTTTGGVDRRSIIVLEIAGAAVSNLEDVSVNCGAASDGVTASLASAPLSTTNANDLLVYYVGLGDDVTAWTAGAGYTIPNNQDSAGNSGSNARNAVETRVVSTLQSATTASMSWSPVLASGHGEMGVFVALKAKP